MLMLARWIGAIKVHLWQAIAPCCRPAWRVVPSPCEPRIRGASLRAQEVTSSRPSDAASAVVSLLQDAPKSTLTHLQLKRRYSGPVPA